MKKKFKMDELQCANCAAKMEAEIKNIPGGYRCKYEFHNAEVDHRSGGE